MSGALATVQRHLSDIWKVPQPATIQEWGAGAEQAFIDPVGDIYSHEHPLVAVAKTVGVFALGPYYFGAAFLKHAGHGLYETGMQAKAMYGTYQHAKSDPNFKFTQFFKNHIGDFSKAGAELRQAGKDLALVGSLWYLSRGHVFGYGNLYGVGRCLPWVTFAAVAYKPYVARSLLNRAENWWRPADAQRLSKTTLLTVNGLVPTLFAATRGDISILDLFNHRSRGNRCEDKQEGGGKRFTIIGESVEISEFYKNLEAQYEATRSSESAAAAAAAGGSSSPTSGGATPAADGSEAESRRREDYAASQESVTGSGGDKKND
jgi:hypothetical protein